jgi:ubiquinone/menaquinone biosynthesis C-methylase UbiE
MVYDVLNLCIPYQELLEELLAALDPKPGEKILDAGGGTGNLALQLARLDAEVTVFDFSKEALAICTKKNDRIRVVCGDLTEELPFIDSYFDKVVSNNTLYTIDREKRNAVISEIFRILKPEGTFVISDLKVGFSPAAIYKNHIKKATKKNLLVELTTVVKMAWPTVKMFYYNGLIKKENRKGGHAFFSEDEHRVLLTRNGFKMDLKPRIVYAKQAELVIARR